MIIGDALSRVFKDLYLCENKINFGYGDQKELNNWILDKNSNRSIKFPLVWYVTNEYTEHNGIYQVSARLIILMNTKLDWRNPTRNEKNYNKYINPIATIVKKTLSKNNFVEIDGSVNFNRFKERDFPNYGLNQDVGIRTSQTDFTSTKKNSTESTIIDITDAKTIDFEMRINAECLIK